MTKEEWIKRYVVHITKRSDVPENLAREFAEEGYQDRVENNDMDEPETAADDELSCWEDDDPIGGAEV